MEIHCSESLTLTQVKPLHPRAEYLESIRQALYNSFSRIERRCTLSLSRKERNPQRVGGWRRISFWYKVLLRLTAGAWWRFSLRENPGGASLRGCDPILVSWYVSYCASACALASLPHSVSLCRLSSCLFLSVVLSLMPFIVLSFALAVRKLRLRSIEPISSKYVRLSRMYILSQAHTWFHSPFLFFHLPCLIFWRFLFFVFFNVILP